jgi:DNA (cytosine-5)-methyltransferase 1
MKAISLFSGAGGCSLGFEQSGVSVIAAYDNNQSAVDTYNKNFGEGKCQNVDLAICNFDAIRLELGFACGELDLIIGGPPCQNELVSNYALALKTFSPRWFVMENVEGILTTSGGSYIINFVQKMIDAGYSVSIEKIYAHEYGIPQRRKRVIIVGSKEGKKFLFPEPTSRAYGSIYRNSSHTLKSAIGDLEDSELPEIDHIPKNEAGIRLERIVALEVGQTMKDLPPELQHSSFSRRANRRVCDGTPTEKRGGAPYGLKRLSYDEPALTITSASISEFVHPTRNRTLTLRECARIQTFPDDFIFIGTEHQKSVQIGNAIPPLLARQLAEQVILSDKEASECVPAGLTYYAVTKADAMSPQLKKTCSMLDEMVIPKYEQMRLSYAY